MFQLRAPRAGKKVLVSQWRNRVSYCYPDSYPDSYEYSSSVHRLCRPPIIPTTTTTTTTATTTTAATTTTTTAAPATTSTTVPLTCRRAGEVYDGSQAACVSVPGAPSKVRVLAGDGALTLTWKISQPRAVRPRGSRSPQVSDFVVRWHPLSSTGSWLRDTVPWGEEVHTYAATWDDVPDVFFHRTWASSLSGLSNGVAYEVQVASRNAAGLSRFVSAAAVPCASGRVYSASAGSCAAASAGTPQNLALTSLNGDLDISWGYLLEEPLNESPVRDFLVQWRRSASQQAWTTTPWAHQWAYQDEGYYNWEITSLRESHIMAWTENNLRAWPWLSWADDALHDVRVAPQYKDGTHGSFVEATAAVCAVGQSYSHNLRKCAAPPTAPTAFTATAGNAQAVLTPRAFPAAGNGQIVLTWTQPSSNGGDTNVDYEVRWRKWGSGDQWATATVPQTEASAEAIVAGPWSASLKNWTYTISGLRNAVRYDVAVSAVNRAGSSPRVEVTLAPCPRGLIYIHTQTACKNVTAPGVPRNLTLTPGSSSITVTWDAPLSAGGAYPIVSYVVQWRKYNTDSTEEQAKDRLVLNVASLRGATRYQATLTGLAAGERYWVEVAAKNNIAQRSGYAYDTATPCVGPYNPAAQSCAAAPSRARGLHTVSADGGLQFSWRAPSSDGGSPITSYKVTWIWSEGGTRHEHSATLTASQIQEEVEFISPEKFYRNLSVRLPFPATLPALKNGLLYAVGVAAINTVGTGGTLFTVGMPCPAEETYKKQYPGCVPRSCPSGLVRNPLNGECAPECGRGEEYNETKGGCRPSDDFCEGNPNLSLARDSSGYCEYAWTKTPAGNDIEYIPVDCDQPSEFSATANADTYINTNLEGKDLTTDKNPMCPPTGLFLALGERRRHQNPTDYYHPEWAIEDELKNDHKNVIARASGDCTVISYVVRLYDKYVREHGKGAEEVPSKLPVKAEDLSVTVAEDILGDIMDQLKRLFPVGSNGRKIVEFIEVLVDPAAEAVDDAIKEAIKLVRTIIRLKDPGLVILETFLDWFAEWKDGVYRLRSGMLASCQAHDYCYDLIRSGLHQTVLKGGLKELGVSGCDEVLRQLWFSYCEVFGFWRQGLCKAVIANGFSSLVRVVASTPPEAGIVVLRNSKTGKCLTLIKAEPAEVVQEHCQFNENHKPNDEDQWFHVLQAEPFSRAADGPTDAGYFYVVPANVNPVDKATWKKSENEVSGGRCLYVGSVSRNGDSRSEVREGSCMVGGVRLSSRVFKLVNTSAVDEYGIRSVGGACWQPDGGDDAEAAADGVYIVVVSGASGCGGALQGWRIEPVDPAAASR